jgi:hypothetical protein
MPIFNSPFAPRGLKTFQDPRDIGLFPQSASDVGQLQNAPLPQSQPSLSDRIRVANPNIDTAPINAPMPGVKTPDLDKYREFLRSQEPQRKDYELGKWGKALSLIAGTAEGYTTGPTRGVTLGQGLLERPYRSAMEDWQTKGGRLKELSDIDVADRAFGTEQGRWEQEQQLRKTADWRANQELLLQSGFTDAQIRNINSMISDRDEKLVIQDGIAWGYNRNTGFRALEKIGETPGEARTGVEESQQRTDAARALLEQETNRLRIGQETAGQKDIEAHRAKIPQPVDIQDVQRAGTMAEQAVQVEEPGLFNRLYITDPASGRVTPNPKATAEDAKTFAKLTEIRKNQLLGKEPKDPVTDDGKIPETDIPRITRRRSAAAMLKRQGIIIDKAAIDDLENQMKKKGYAQPGYFAVPSNPKVTDFQQLNPGNMSPDVLNEMRRYGYGPPPDEEATPATTPPPVNIPPIDTGPILQPQGVFRSPMPTVPGIRSMESWYLNQPPYSYTNLGTR